MNQASANESGPWNIKGGLDESNPYTELKLSSDRPYSLGVREEQAFG